MQLLRLKTSAGPKHYIFKDPDTQHTYESNSMKGLIEQIVNYRMQNELEDIQHLNLVLENYWAGLPENLENAEVAPPLKRGFLAYLKGGIALVTNLWYGDANMVDQDVANARSTICMKCPHNVFPDKGPFLAWSDAIAENSVGDRRSIKHDAIGSCEVCSCPLRAKVFYKGPFTCSKAEMEKFPDFCWQRAECEKQIKKV